MSFNPLKSGSIEVVCGSMFSGKTEELLRRVRRAKIARQSVRIFKPKLDTRYDRIKVVSHDDNYIDSFPVKRSADLMKWAGEIEVIGIDEAQFFDNKLPEYCNQLANSGKRVIVAGLDMDYLGAPFKNMAHLLAIADEIDKVKAICMKCGEDALYSYRFSASKERVLLGEKDHYEPRCRSCYEQPND
jgi:thymidine kinase